MARILITGANGQLGMSLRRIGFSASDDAFFTDVNDLDITDIEAIRHFVRTNEIDTIVNCAAYTAVDKAEEDLEKAVTLNTIAVAKLATVAYEEACLLIHISTDYVFDGTATEPYTEHSHPNPQSVYGKSKLGGERAILKSQCIAIIIRTAWLYSEYGNNFVKTMLRLAKEKGELRVVADQYGTPTYAGDLARAIVAIVSDTDAAEKSGIYHFTDEGQCSWYDFAKEIVADSGLTCKVHPLRTEEYPTKAFRPAYSVLDKGKIKRMFGLEIPDWKEPLAHCVEELGVRS